MPKFRSAQLAIVKITEFIGAANGIRENWQYELVVA